MVILLSLVLLPIASCFMMFAQIQIREAIFVVELHWSVGEMFASWLKAVQRNNGRAKEVRKRGYLCETTTC